MKHLYCLMALMLSLPEALSSQCPIILKDRFSPTANR